jgi:hypothetical protein
MIAIPPWFAFLLGAAIGVLSYGPVKRWMIGLQRARVDQAAAPDTQSAQTRALLVIFTTMHPAPWLLILGVPVAAYQLLFGPLRVAWLWLILGVLTGVAAIFLYESAFLRKSSELHQRPRSIPPS